MACASISMSDIIQPEEEEPGIGQPLIRQYYGCDLVPGKKRPLQDLLNKQPMALGVVQLVVGIACFGLGVNLAATSHLSLAVVFRVPILTGLLFFVCGVLSSVLNRYTRLLPICFAVNIGCLSVAGVAIVLLAIDLSFDENCFHYEKKDCQMKVLILCVTVLKACISALLVFWLHPEMHSMRKSSDSPVS